MNQTIEILLHKGCNGGIGARVRGAGRAIHVEPRQLRLPPIVWRWACALLGLLVLSACAPTYYRQPQLPAAQPYTAISLDTMIAHWPASEPSLDTPRCRWLWPQIAIIHTETQAEQARYCCAEALFTDQQRYGGEARKQWFADELAACRARPPNGCSRNGHTIVVAPWAEVAPVAAHEIAHIAQACSEQIADTGHTRRAVWDLERGGFPWEPPIE